jgi:AbrB family looped-hinge helix DNA binding protein
VVYGEGSTGRNRVCELDGGIIVLQFRFDEGEVKMENLTTISSKYQIVIPRDVREKFNLKPGQKVMFIPYQKSIRLVIVPSIKEALGMFKGMNADHIREEEDEER